MLEEGILCGGSCGAAMHYAIKYAQEHGLDERHRVVVLLPDGVRNYMTKSLSKDWMIEQKFLPLTEYDNKYHQLNQFTLADLNLTPVKTYEKSITIGDALIAL